MILCFHHKNDCFGEFMTFHKNWQARRKSSDIKYSTND